MKLIEKQNLDIIKIASCSFNDWPLLERIVENQKPIIASTAGASEKEIDKVVSFLQHRKKEFAIMHCVAEYPTPDKNINLAQINYLKKRYPNVRIGFSTHENPSDERFILMAYSMGASIFERHVALQSNQFSIITREADGENSKIHHRQPLILNKSKINDYLNVKNNAKEDEIIEI